MRLPWRRTDRNAELEDEIRGHLEMAAQDHAARGESPKQAQYAARREFGNATLVKEITRTMWGGLWLQDLGQDVRLAARSLRRTPVFTLTVIAMLGLGVGTAAAMYGILDRLLLRPPEQVRDADHLYAVYVTHAASTGADITRGYLSWYEAHLLVGGNEVLAASAVYGGPSSTLIAIGDRSLSVQVVMATVGYFDVLGTRPALGRFFSPEDSAASAPPVAVIGSDFWRRQFGAAKSVLGGTLRVGNRIYTIVGVAPRGFSGAAPEEVDLWVPADHALDPARRELGYRWQVIGRTRSAPQQAASAALLRLQTAPPGPRSAPYKYRDVKLASTIPGRAPTGPSSTLRLSYLVTGAATLMALVALANAVGLLMLRALRRGRETAVRLVLGVSRGRLLRAVAVESMLLALMAGAAASVVAAMGGELLRSLLLRAEWAVPVVDMRVVGATVAVSFLVGAASGVLTGWLGGRPETIATLRAGGHDSASHRAPARAALLAVQGALSVALVAGLAMFSRSFQRARAFDFGPDVDQLLLADLRDFSSGPLMLHPVPPGVTREAMERVAALRGVESVAAVSAAPLSMMAITELRAEGVDSLPRGRTPSIVAATANYFAATGLRVVRGRLFFDQGPGGPRETLVSQEMARVLWPQGDAIGRCLYIGQGATGCSRVVGVVTDLHPWLARPYPLLTYYVPLSQAVTGDAGSLVIRTEVPARLVPAVREIVASVAGVHDLGAVRALRDVVDPQYRQLRQAMALFGIFAGLAVVVAMIGIYSVVAYSVTQRAHEFAIRVALGARGGNLVRLVLAQALRYAGAGLALGLVLALVGGRYVAPLLYQTSARDPLALGAAAFGLLLAAALACVVPASAAARVDPRQALQAE